MAKSHWFRRLESELPGISPHLRLVYLKMGFYRLYFKQAYVHEVYESMPEMGYTIEDYDPRLESQSYYEEYEDHVSTVRTLKNYVEGYRDSMDRIRTRVYMFRNNEEFYQEAVNAYKQMVVK